MLPGRSASKGDIVCSIKHTDTIDNPKFAIAEFVFKESGTCVELGMFIEENMTKQEILHKAIQTLSNVDCINVEVSNKKVFETANQKKESIFKRVRKLF